MTQLQIAPGYNLQIQIPVKARVSLKDTLSFSGIGAQSNRYWSRLAADYALDTAILFERRHSREICQPKESYLQMITWSSLLTCFNKSILMKRIKITLLSFS